MRPVKAAKNRLRKNAADVPVTSEPVTATRHHPGTAATPTRHSSTTKTATAATLKWDQSAGNATNNANHNPITEHQPETSDEQLQHPEPPVQDNGRAREAMTQDEDPATTTTNIPSEKLQDQQERTKTIRTTGTKQPKTKAQEETAATPTHPTNHERNTW